MYIRIANECVHSMILFASKTFIRYIDYYQFFNRNEKGRKIY
jgi:hypothetical protein